MRGHPDEGDNTRLREIGGLQCRGGCGGTLMEEQESKGPKAGWTAVSGKHYCR